MKTFFLFFLSLLALSQIVIAQPEDPYLWLEEVEGKKALEFVEQQNKITLDKLSREEEYQNIYAKSLEIYNSADRIVYPAIRGDYIYNFWQDKDHERGIWRRSPKSVYDSGNPEWDILLDLDEMYRKDSIKWVFKGVDGLYPEYNRFLVRLSKGGGDAVIIREFDATTKSFPDNGFFLDESKQDASYLDENTVIVSTDFGGNTMTTSGYPRQIKLWKRGSSLMDACLILEGKETDMGVFGGILRDDSINYLSINRMMTFFSGHSFVWLNDSLIKLDIPDDCQISALLKNQLVIKLKSDWEVGRETFKQGSVVSLNFTGLLKGEKDTRLILEPDEYSSVTSVSSTKNKLLINVLTNVKNELYIYSFIDGVWETGKANAPDFGSITIITADEFSDQYFFDFENFLSPTTLYIADAGDNSLREYQSLPAYFDASKFKVGQYKAKSFDGTLIPYFVVSSADMNYDGTNPTLLYAYGGFEISELPFYSGVTGNAWLEKGGVYVMANIRGGGEFGPNWHQSGLKEKRQTVYNDFYAVTEDIILRKITSAGKLGIMGGSNGGLLVGVAFTQHPELYNAVVCAVPLLDMQRYNKLLAGASWMGEYGDPDKPEEWEYIRKYSPYHNLKDGMKYPEVFFYTSTRDDRVHPGHARKMVAKMIDMGYTVYYYENTEGGHAGSSTNEQRAKWAALQYSYLLMKLKK
jgi:prolyl oligopeptidase